MSGAVGARPPGGLHSEPEPTSAKDRQEPAALGLTSATGLVIGTIIGAGVFTMPAVLASAGTRFRGVRPGREPDAHHQGPDDRHARPAVMTALLTGPLTG